MINFLRKSRAAMWLLTAARVILGFQWLQIGLDKLTNADGFDAGHLINSALDGTVSPGWFQSALGLMTNGGESTWHFTFLIPWTQVLVGVALIFGAFTTLATLGATLMNVAFLLSGVIGDNPLFLIFQLMILIAGFNAARIGLDTWLMPWIKGLPAKWRLSDAQRQAIRSVNSNWTGNPRL